tara:strand:+ start:850 stop:2619 length:1770 start_codon:yes stop_codon:yes gene_type:complete
MYKILLSLLFLLMATPAKAALEVTIYLMRSATDATTATTTYDYVDQYTISHTNSADFVQAVNRVTGLNLVQSGPTGQNVSLFMRGGDSNHTLVTMNGLPIGDASTTNGLHDFGNNFMGTITGIEIVKNPSGAMVGPNSIGGVVNFITGDVYESSIDFGLASNDTRSIRAKTFTTVDNTVVSISIDGTSSDGISVVPNGAESDGYDARSINVSTNTITESGKLKTSHTVTNNNSDLDTTVDDTDYTATVGSHIHSIHYTQGKTSLAYGYSAYDRTYVNGSETDTYDSERHTLLGTYTITGNGVDIVPGIEYTNVSADFNNTGSYTSSVDAWEYNTAIFVNTNWIATEDWIISTGIRRDTLEDYDDYTTARIGSSYTISSDLQLRTNWSNSVRTPTLYERYGADNYGYTGNKLLEVERGETIDVGFTLGQLDVVYYTTWIDNAITYSNSTYTNSAGTSTRKGVEMNYAHQLTEEWHHDIGAHWSVAEDSDHSQLLRRPRWTVNNSLSKTVDKYTTTLAHTYTGTHVDLDASTYARKDMPGVHTFDLHHTVYFDTSTSISASIRNITDESYEQPDGYAQDGRNFAITYSKKF